jgi:hypothetical protein
LAEAVLKSATATDARAEFAMSSFNHRILRVRAAPLN